MSETSIIAVHYHAADLLADAVASAVRERDRAGASGGIVVVDNGSTADELERIRRLPVRVVEPGRNLGFAGGVNLGVAQAGADRFVVMNPDVILLPGCLRALFDALESGYAAAGPRFFWDTGRRLLLPPLEPWRRRDAILRRLAATYPVARRWFVRAGRDNSRRHWRARSTFPSAGLCGALMAFTREAWTRTGPFDDGYRLYFEETDWLNRLRRAGLKSAFVPAAEAVHLYAQSTAREPMAGAWFADSRRRFERRHFGRLCSAALWREPSVETCPPGMTPLPPGPPEVRVAAGPVWVEVAASPSGYPAAGEWLAAPPDDGCWRLPDEVWRRLGPGRYYLRLVEEDGRERAAYRFDRPAERM